MLELDICILINPFHKIFFSHIITGDAIIVA